MAFDIFEYSEKSARAKLARHRARGETNLSMICVHGKWYVGEFDPCPACDGLGRVWKDGMSGTTRPCGKCKGAGERAAETES
jgi:hypothetical protein